jgi:hypothetical protein
MAKPSVARALLAADQTAQVPPVGYLDRVRAAQAEVVEVQWPWRSSRFILVVAAPNVPTSMRFLNPAAFAMR